MGILLLTSKGKKLLVIRLSRKGRKNLPMYRLTVAENSMPTDGKFVEIVGTYNPTALGQPLVIEKERIEYWISKGAQPSNTVAKLLNKQGFSLPVEQRNRPPKKEVKPEEAPKVTPAPTEEAPQVTEEILTEEVKPEVAEEVVEVETTEATPKPEVLEEVANIPAETPTSIEQPVEEEKSE